MNGTPWHANPHRYITRAVRALCIDDTWRTGDISVRRGGNHRYTVSSPGTWDTFDVQRGNVARVVERVMMLRDMPRTKQIALFKDAS